jgi:hypothetical protein
MSSTTNTPEKTTTYFQQRMDLLGITEEQNKIELWQTIPLKIVKDANGVGTRATELVPFPVFSIGTKPAGIDILVYNLDRQILKAERIRDEKTGSTWKDAYKLTRLEQPITRKDGSTQKYNIPKGAGTYPFFHPALIKKFENKEKIDTLFITEGFFKAWKGCMHGMDVVGVSSITHLKEKDTGLLHIDIRRLRDICQVKRIVWLTDGDCLDITSKDLTDGIDLHKRPISFFRSCETFKNLLDDWEGEKWFFHIDSDNIISRHKGMTRDKVKGLDDLLISFPEAVEEIAADANHVAGPGTWFAKQNITISTRKIYSYFHLLNINDFYLFHKERRPEIENIEFVFAGSRYKYDDKDNECKIIVPGASKLYFRVGDTYYKFIEKINEEGHVEHAFEKRMKGTIVDDHGTKFTKHIPKYEAFCNYPSHTDYQQVIHNNFNVYFPFEHEPEAQQCTEEDCKYIINFIKHIFGEKLISVPQREGKPIQTAYYQLALDYIQLMYQRPIQRLPILCLVSRENETGKSTFGNLLKAIFTNNATTVGNNDLADDFNSFWATKLLIMCDETKIDKQAVVEKVKSLTFAKKIGLNSKGRDKIEIPFFGKFMFFTNNEENFIYASEEDLRYWVIKVPRIKEKNPDLETLMLDEIPAFLSFLNHRKLVAQRETRMWFNPDLLRTDALKKVIEWSQSTVKKDLRHHIRQMFLDFGVDTIEMSLKDIRENFFKNKEENYIERVLKDEMKMQPFHQFIVDNDRRFDVEGEAIAYVAGLHKITSELECLAHIKKKYTTKRYSYPRLERKSEFGSLKSEPIVVSVSCLGRPYIFYKKDFLLDNEESDVPAEMRIPAGADTPPAQPDNELPF